MLTRLADTAGVRPRATLLLVLLFVVVAGVVGGPLAGKLTAGGGFVPATSESAVAVRELHDASGRQASDGLALVVDTPAGAAAAKPRVAAVTDRVAALDGVARAAGPAAVSTDRRKVLVSGTLRADAGDDAVAGAALDAFAGARDVTVGGSVVADRQIGETVSKDLGRAELIASPLLVLLSILFFRGRAALLPLAVGVTTVLGTFLVLTAVNAVYGLNVFALNLVIGLGLGLAIDYTLFLVTRFREELAAGRASAPAIRRTLATAGRTVVFSAATVAAALITLTLFPQGFLKSMGLAGATVALVAAVAALVVSTALLGLWGAKLARQSRPAAAGRWYRFAHAVMRRPGPIAAATALVMLALALPALGTHWTPVDSSAIPKRASSRVVADALDRDFAGAGQTPVIVAIHAPSGRPGEVAAYARRVAAIDGVRRVAAPERLSGDVWQLDATATGEPAGAAARRVVHELRALPAPFSTKVAGDAAEFIDQQAAIASRLLPAVALLCGLTFLVLWLMTGSVVLPVKAILMNALTVGAALAPLILIYQHGRLTGLLGYTPNGGVEPTDFLVTAAVVFALSTDYGVFLLGRIKEARDAGLGEREAVATGLSLTGRVVTAAAILLAVAIGAFSTSSISFIQQVGVATATGVLIDAFVVRSLLVPSLMALLGRFNWWAPRGVRRLHDRVGLRQTSRPPTPAGRPS